MIGSSYSISFCVRGSVVTLGGARFAAGADMIEAPYVYGSAPSWPLGTYGLRHFAFAALCVDTLRDFLDLLLDLSCGVVVAVAGVAGGYEESSDRDAECGCDEGGGGCECVVPRVGHWAEEL